MYNYIEPKKVESFLKDLRNMIENKNFNPNKDIEILLKRRQKSEMILILHEYIIRAWI